MQVKRAARAQRAEFANRGPDGFASAEFERKRKRKSDSTVRAPKGGGGTDAVALQAAPVQARALLQSGG